MIRYPGKVSRFSSKDGMMNYVPEDTELFLPETDMEIAMKVVSLKTPDEEILVFEPTVIVLKKSVIPSNIPDEEEIEERDR